MGLAVVGPFAHGIGVMNDEGKTRTCATSGPLQHLEVAVRIAKGRNGAAADMMIDPDWLAGFVVDEVQLGQAHVHGFAVTQFELCFDAATDDLLGRNAVDLLRPRAHELDAAAGNDEGLEAVRAQVGEHFKHRLIDHLGKRPLGYGVLGGGEPVFDDLREFIGGHAGVCGHNDLQYWPLTASERALNVALEQ